MTTSIRPRHCRFGPVDVAWDDRVIEPRPWTLLQSEWAADLARTAAPGPLLELCAGAGHIGLAAAVLSGRAIVQVEADAVAARYASVNAASAGVASVVRCAHLTDALGEDETFPIVVADPPYLPTRDVGRWADDPVHAIDGGPDGLDVVRDCLDVTAAHLAPGGALLLQVAGEAQARTTAVLAQASGWRCLEVRSHDPERAVMRLERTTG